MTAQYDTHLMLVMCSHEQVILIEIHLTSLDVNNNV